jgi:hypothetical protein
MKIRVLLDWDEEARMFSPFVRPDLMNALKIENCVLSKKDVTISRHLIGLGPVQAVSGITMP